MELPQRDPPDQRDAETGLAYTIVDNQPAFAGSQVSLEEGEWPYLTPAGGVNLISWSGGTVTKVEIQPNWRYL